MSTNEDRDGSLDPTPPIEVIVTSTETPEHPAPLARSTSSFLFRPARPTDSTSSNRVDAGISVISNTAPMLESAAIALAELRVAADAPQAGTSYTSLMQDVTRTDSPLQFPLEGVGDSNTDLEVSARQNTSGEQLSNMLASRGTSNQADSSTSSVQRLQSSIQGLREALHERVMALGQEVERLRGRAAELESGFAANRTRRDGTTSTSTETEPLIGRREETESALSKTYDVEKGSGSAEIEGSKEERRKQRLAEMRKNNAKLELRLAFNREINSSYDTSRLPPILSDEQADRHLVAGVERPEATSSLPVPAPAAMLAWATLSGGVPASSQDPSLTARGVRVTNMLDRINARQISPTPAESVAVQSHVEAHQAVMRGLQTLRADRRYRDALMNREVPPPVREGRFASTIRSLRGENLVGRSSATISGPDSQVDNTGSTVTPSDPVIASDDPRAGAVASRQQELTENVHRLRRLLADLRTHHQTALGIPSSIGEARSNLLDTEFPASEARTMSLAALESAMHSLSELLVLHEMLQGLHGRLDNARASLRDSATFMDNTPALSDLRSENLTVPLLRHASGRSRTRNEVTTAPTSSRLAPRRPSYPFVNNTLHPHHRPVIGPDPLAVIVNIDNANSFEIRLDGDIVFRPIARREPDIELIARCLSMMPGGREDTPSRWMRLTGGSHARHRRAGSMAGYWVRWISEQLYEVEQPRQRRLDTRSMPRIIAFDFCVTPPEDDAFLRFDEAEFHTARTRLRSHMGPWMHSRVRTTPFPHDPAVARWGTSAHVRQAIRGLGEINAGDFARFDLHDRTVTLVRAPQLNTVARNMEALVAGRVPRTESATRQAESSASNPVGSQGETTRTSSIAWLGAFEPAVTQIQQHWRAHVSRNNLATEARSVASGFPSEQDNSIGRHVESGEAWTRDYLDPNGEPLPAIPLPLLTENDTGL